MSSSENSVGSPAGDRVSGNVTRAHALIESPRFKAAKAELLAIIGEASQSVRAIRPPAGESAVRESYLQEIKEFNALRGRDLYFPFLGSGLGSGPFVELKDGSVKLDMITGIGVNLFGHSNPDFIAEMIDALPADVMQGNLEPGFEASELLKALLSRVGIACRLKHAWLTTCGTMANEIALKIIRQKKAPATKVLAFQDCFAGRSTAMQEITDNPAYRVGQPVYGEVEYLPFYDSSIGLEASVDRTLKRMREHLSRFPDKFAALTLELVQGEGGFNFAPRDFYVRVFEEAKKFGLAIWVDEVQTFGRTGELFAYQKFCLNEFVDVVTVAKSLQASVVIFSSEYNPKPGLVAGTFSGSSGALRSARRVLEVLTGQGHLGPSGKIEMLSARFVDGLARVKRGLPEGALGEVRAIGAMIAFQPFAGKMDDIKAVLTRLFDLGVVAFYCGHGPYLIRMLPPFVTMNEKEVDLVCELIGQALREEQEKRKV
jgi:4-aminobutyrate aminotransferase-like enzyme